MVPEEAAPKTGFYSLRPSVFSTKGMVVAGTPLAAAAGAEILRAGGTAMDAAISASAVQCVVMPHMGGLGGDLFLLHADADNEIIALTGAGQSPLLASREAYRDFRTKMPEQGILSVSVPGFAGGWFEALRRFGKLPYDRIFDAAIRLAESGFPIHKNLIRYFQTKHFRTHLKADSGLGRSYLPEGTLPKPAALLRQPRLAATLRTLVERGPSEFYSGALAHSIVAEVKRRGGLLGLEDLVRYAPRWSRSLSLATKGWHLHQTPPPSQGVTMLQILRICEYLGIDRQPHNSVDYVHSLAEATKVALADRDRVICDPETVRVDVDALLSAEYAKSAAHKISTAEPQRAQDKIAGESTTCLVVADSAGNVVSLSQSLGDEFGSGVYVEELGFALQNRMKGFTLEERHPNCVVGGRIPMHTLCPSIAHKPDGSRLVLVTPGGSAQPQTLAQVFMNIVQFGMDCQEAVEAPRFACLSGQLMLEGRFPAETFRSLAARHHDAVALPDWSSVVGGCAALEITPDATRIAGADPRRDSYAVAE